MEINYEIFSEKKFFFPNDPVFSNWVNVKIQVLKLKSFKDIYFFFFESQKLKIFEKRSPVFLSVYLRVSWLCVSVGSFSTVSWLCFFLQNLSRSIYP